MTATLAEVFAAEEHEHTAPSPPPPRRSVPNRHRVRKMLTLTLAPEVSAFVKARAPGGSAYVEDAIREKAARDGDPIG